MHGARYLVWRVLNIVFVVQRVQHVPQQERQIGFGAC